MGRFRLAIWVVLACIAPEEAASAAEMTRLATAAEPNDAFDFQLSVRWDHVQEKALITREHALPAGAGQPFGAVADAAMLRYERDASLVVPRIAIGLFRDLELHAELPYVVSDNRDVRYALVNGTPADTVYPDAAISQNTVDAMDRTCAGAPCPLFSVPGTVYHGGQLGDLMIGLAYAPLNQKKDGTASTLVVGLDVTAPTAARYDPALGRGATTWDSPYTVPTNPGPLGERIWKVDAWTALSRVYGPAEPYLRAHLTATRPSGDTYSNCDHASAMSTNAPEAQFTLAGAQNCNSSVWSGVAGAQLPWMAGMTFGVELVPYENASTGQKISFDLRGSVDYRSEERFYNQLTDFTGKILFTQAYYTLAARAAMHLKASRTFQVDVLADYQKETDHFLTGESLGNAGVTAGDVTGATANAALNPNFDWRWDAPGKRFRLTQSDIVTLSVAAHLNF